MLCSHDIVHVCAELKHVRVQYEKRRITFDLVKLATHLGAIVGDGADQPMQVGDGTELGSVAELVAAGAVCCVVDPRILQETGTGCTRPTSKKKKKSKCKKRMDPRSRKINKKARRKTITIKIQN